MLWLTDSLSLPYNSTKYKSVVCLLSLSPLLSLVPCSPSNSPLSFLSFPLALSPSPLPLLYPSPSPHTRNKSLVPRVKQCSVQSVCSVYVLVYLQQELSGRWHWVVVWYCTKKGKNRPPPSASSPHPLTSTPFPLSPTPTLFVCKSTGCWKVVVACARERFAKGLFPLECGDWYWS